MSAEIVAIADAVAAAYSGGYAADPRTLSQSLDVERGYVPGEGWQLDKLAVWTPNAAGSRAVRVYVATESEETNVEKSLRGLLYVEYEIQVAIAAKPRDTDKDCVDPLMLLLQEMRDYFFKDDQTRYDLPGRSERAIKIETLAHPDLQRMELDRLFHAGFVLTFQGWRSR